MEKSAAEKVFAKCLYESATVKKNGITHSDEFYETMLSDANLSHKESVDVLVSIRQKSTEEIENLKERRNEISQIVAEFEDEPTLDRAIKKQQQIDYRYHVFLLSIVLFVAAIIITANILAIVVKIPLNAYLIAAIIILLYLASFILAEAITDKTKSFTETEVDFMKKIRQQQKRISVLDADVLSLERLINLVDRILKLDMKQENLDDDLK